MLQKNGYSGTILDTIHSNSLTLQHTYFKHERIVKELPIRAKITDNTVVENDL